MGYRSVFCDENDEVLLVVSNGWYVGPRIAGSIPHEHIDSGGVQPKAHGRIKQQLRYLSRSSRALDLRGNVDDQQPVTTFSLFCTSSLCGDTHSNISLGLYAAETSSRIYKSYRWWCFLTQTTINSAPVLFALAASSNDRRRARKCAYWSPTFPGRCMHQHLGMLCSAGTYR